MTSVRDALAEATSTVEGVSATPYYRRGLHPGHGFIRLERIDYPNPFGGVVRWNVIVVLPQDLSAAEPWLEQKLPALREAIEPHLVITEVVPQQLQLDAESKPLFCVFITGHREE